MKPKLTEVDKLKYWLDSEITILHIMFAVVVWLLTNSHVVHILLALYMIFSTVYLLTRLAYVANFDRNYLRIPKK
jgi:hypothetical protein